MIKVSILKETLEQDSLKFRVEWNVKKIKCKLFGHKFELEHSSNGELPMRVYTCKCCGLMSFKVNDRVSEIPTENRMLNPTTTLFSDMMFVSIVFYMFRLFIYK